MLKILKKVKHADQELPKYKKFTYTPNELICIYSSKEHNRIESVVTYIFDEVTNTEESKSISGRVLYIYGKDEGKVAKMEMYAPTGAIKIDGVPTIVMNPDYDELVKDSNGHYLFKSLDYHNNNVFDVISKDALISRDEERLSYDAIKSAVNNHNKKLDIINAEKYMKQQKDKQRRDEIESLF